MPKNRAPASSVNIFILQASIGTKELESLVRAYQSVPKNRAPRFIAVTPNILHCNKDENLHRFVRFIRA
jgi:hypothetical protein